MYQNLIKDKSENFALKIISLYHQLKEKKEYIISKQILRSATSVGANIAESSVAPSKKDFLNKVFIAYKEAEETKYWLNLLIKSNYFNNNTELNSLREEITVILKILNKIVQQTRNNLSKKSSVA